VRQALEDNDTARFYQFLDAGLRGVPSATFTRKTASITYAEAHHSAMIPVVLPLVLPKGHVVRTEAPPATARSTWPSKRLRASLCAGTRSLPFDGHTPPLRPPVVAHLTV
jgi:hypothetical protein